MDLKDFILIGLDRARQTTLKAIDGLTCDEIKWRPGPGANSIGILAFHQARSEDAFVHTIIQGKPQVWVSEKWYERMKLRDNDTGSHFTVEQVAAFCVPEMSDVLAYGDAVRALTAEYIKALTAKEFDRVVKMARWGDVTVGTLFSAVIVHSSMHAGDI